jgi:hypothetical protein
MRADKLRDPDCAVKTLPCFQRIQAEYPNWLSLFPISLQSSISGEYGKELLAVSHRWETSEEPDPDGEQLEAVKNHLRQHTQVNFVWYDYWCLPQDGECKRTATETRFFRNCLENSTTLFLGLDVLILLDLQYQVRFWTQFEAWLSMRSTCADGLVGASQNFRAYIVCLGLANQDHRQALLTTWAETSVRDAFIMLSNKEVLVTNQKDKASQLPKIVHINHAIRRVCGNVRRLTRFSRPSAIDDADDDDDDTSRASTTDERIEHDI